MVFIEDPWLFCIFIMDPNSKLTLAEVVAVSMNRFSPILSPTDDKNGKSPINCFSGDDFIGGEALENVSSMTLPEEGDSLKKIRISFSSLMKLIQQRRLDYSSNSINGKLFGKEVKYGSKSTEVIAEISDFINFNENVELNEDVLKCYRDLNFDYSVVGLIISMDTFNNEFISELINLQEDNKFHVFLSFDLGKTLLGAVDIKAYRLTQEFIINYKAKKLIDLSNISSAFREIDIEVSMSILDQLFLEELMEDSEFPSISTIPIPQNNEIIMNKDERKLIANLDEMLSETSKFQNYLKSSSKQQHALSSQLQKLKFEKNQSGQSKSTVSSVLSNFKNLSEAPIISSFASSLNLHTSLESFEN